MKEQEDNDLCRAIKHFKVIENKKKTPKCGGDLSHNMIFPLLHFVLAALIALINK